MSIEKLAIVSKSENNIKFTLQYKRNRLIVISRRQDMQSYSQIINHLVKRIIEEVHPLRIILFGSAATGEIGPDSDVDLLIVMPDGVHRRRTAQLLYRKIRGIDVPFDVIVATPTDLEKHKDNIGLIYRTILQEGKEVYAARNGKPGRRK